jgi:tetratricopeptide (TPR) repeat protein
MKILGAIVAIVCVALLGYFWLQEAPLRQARSLIEQSETGAALELIDAWERQHSPTGRSQALRARCYVENGRFAEAIHIFQAVGVETEEEIHDLAHAYLTLQRWSDALPLLNDLRRRDPDHANVLHELAACQTKLGMLDDALRTAQEFAGHEEFSHRAWLLVGAIQKERGNQQKALDAWKRIAEFDPEYQDLQIAADEFLTQFASLQIELGNLKEAEQLVIRSLSIRESAEAHFQAGLAADLQGDSTRAEQHWQRALEFNPYHLNTRESLARVAIAAGDGSRAESILKPILQAGPDRSSTAYLMQRAALLRDDKERADLWRQTTDRLRRKESIDSAVSQVLKDNPKSYWALVIRAYQFAERGNPHQAEQLLDSLPTAKADDPFVADLKKAVRTRGELPAKDRIPIELF